MSTRELTWAMLQALPEAQQRAFWEALLARWKDNAEQELDDDVEFDRDPDRVWWE